MHVLHNCFGFVINTTAYHLDRYKPSNPSTKDLIDLIASSNREIVKRLFFDINHDPSFSLFLNCPTLCPIIELRKSVKITFGSSVCHLNGEQEEQCDQAFLKLPNLDTLVQGFFFILPSFILMQCTYGKIIRELIEVVAHWVGFEPQLFV